MTAAALPAGPHQHALDRSQRPDPDRADGQPAHERLRAGRQRAASPRAWSVAGGYAYQDAFVTSATAAARAGARGGPGAASHPLALEQLPGPAAARRGGRASSTARTCSPPSTTRVTLPGYTRVDLAAYYALTKDIRLQANVENAFDTEYWVNADSNTNISPGFGRALRIGISAGVLESRASNRRRIPGMRILYAHGESRPRSRATLDVRWAATDPTRVDGSRERLGADEAERTAGRGGRSALGRHRRRRPSFRADAPHRPAGPRGRAVPERLRGDAAVLAQPRQHPDRPVHAPPRDPRQHRPQRQEPRPRDVPSASSRPAATRPASSASGTWATTRRRGRASTTGWA